MSVTALGRYLPTSVKRLRLDVDLIGVLVAPAGQVFLLDTSEIEKETPNSNVIE